jgi:phage terminase large subunit-like protein
MDLATVVDGALRVSLHPGQELALRSNRRFVLVLAGTQGGKTSFGPHWLYREIKRRGAGDYLVVTPTFQLLEKKCLPEFLRVFKHWLKLGRYVASPSRVFTFSVGGCQRTFGKFDLVNDAPTRVMFGYADDPDSLESATAKAAWLDEAGQKRFRLESWEAIQRRLAIHEGRALITTTPYSLNWLKLSFVDLWAAGD